MSEKLSLEKLSEIIGVAVVKGSDCWSKTEDAGRFDHDKADKIQDEVVNKIAALLLSEPKQVENCEWTLVSGSKPDRYTAPCRPDGTLTRTVGERCHICGKEINITIPRPAKEPAPEGMVEIEIVAGETVFTESMMLSHDNGSGWRPCRSSVGKVAIDERLLRACDLIENVLPPAPEGTLWYKTKPGDKWMDGDIPGEREGKVWWDVTLSGLGHYIDKPCEKEMTLHGFICRVPCTWKAIGDTDGYVIYRCECGFEDAHETLPDSCPKCNRPIKEAKPELRYVEISEGGFMPHRDCEWQESAFVPFHANEIKESLGLKFVGWATEDGNETEEDVDIYVIPNPIMWGGQSVTRVKASMYTTEEARTINCTFAVFEVMEVK